MSIPHQLTVKPLQNLLLGHFYCPSPPYPPQHSFLVGHRLIRQFTPVLALRGPFGVDVPLNFDITIIITHPHTLTRLYCISVTINIMLTCVCQPNYLQVVIHCLNLGDR